MKGKIMAEIFGSIDDDLIVAADRNTEKRRNRIPRWCAVACLVLCAVIAAPLLARESAEPGKQSGTQALNEAGGVNGKINVSDECRLTGTAYAVSNEEGYAFLTEMSSAIRGELAACGVPVENFRISRTGFSHLRTGRDGNSMAVDWRDFPAYNGDELIAMLSVTRDEGGLRYYSAWGSPGFGQVEEFFKAHRGEELVMLWVGDVDAILTPDHQIFCLSDLAAAGVIDEEEQSGYYAFFKWPENTYVPE